MIMLRRVISAATVLAAVGTLMCVHAYPPLAKVLALLTVSLALTSVVLQ